MEILRLTERDCRLLSTRFADHGNSHRGVCAAFRDDERAAEAERLEALRRMELRFGIDLGSLCYRFLRREAAHTHPLEKLVLDYIADWRTDSDGENGLWVRLDHVRKVRQLMEEDELVREPES